MSKLDDLKAERTEIEKKVTALQKENAAMIFNVEVEDVSMVKTIQDHLNKGYTWETKNAAIVVTLFDRLKAERARIRKEMEETTEDYTPALQLKAYELNGLYQALLNVRGTGVENARKFVKMLTLVGESVTNAMNELTESNKEVSDLHIRLKDLDVNIDSLENTEEVEPKLEIVDETKG
tara:strand:- start:6024 stop:6560 length:537 start_codon:yes stop_codon:yes gene_type:complete